MTLKVSESMSRGTSTGKDTTDCSRPFTVTGTFSESMASPLLEYSRIFIMPSITASELPTVVAVNVHSSPE